MTLSTYAGGSVYSHSEYDNYTASSVRETVVRLWDWSLLRYRLARATIADLGRAEPVTPADADIQLAEDITLFAQSGAVAAMTEQARRNRIKRDEERLVLLIAILRRRPGARVMVLQAETDGRISAQIVGRLLREHSEIFRSDGSARKARWYVRDDRELP